MWTWTLVLGAVALVVGLAAWLFTHEDDPKEAERQFFRAQARTVLAELRLTYIDLGGAMTNREVIVFKVYPRLRKFEAFCRLRQGQRTFYFDSVKEAVDLATGEIIPDMGAFFKRR